jgi:hypothetical protein
MYSDLTVLVFAVPSSALLLLAAASVLVRCSFDFLWVALIFLVHFTSLYIMCKTSGRKPSGSDSVDSDSDVNLFVRPSRALVLP